MGIDILMHDTKTNSYNGIASRIQKINKNINNNKPYNTFTIRTKRFKNSKLGSQTEYEKRVYAIKHNNIYPKYTLQCYVDEKTNKLLSAAIIHTRDLYRYVLNHKQELLNKNNCECNGKGDSNEFIAIHWYNINDLIIKKGRIKRRN